jgi:hypothetical protein
MAEFSAFQFHSQPDAYVAALRTYRPGGAVPVLGPRLQAHDAVAALSTAEPTRPVAPPGAVLVSWPAGSKTAEAAQALADSVAGIAREHGSPADVGELSGNAEYVLLVALAEEIGERQILAIHDSLWKHRGSSAGGHLGFLVAADLADLSWLIAKGLALPHRVRPDESHLRIWPVVQKAPRRYGTGRWILQGDCKASTIRPALLDTYTSAVSVLAHGRDDVIHFNDTVICPVGARRLGPGTSAATHAPVCAFTGHCYRPEVANEDIVLSGHIRADVVFANSCMGMRVGDGLFPAEYLMPEGFIRGIAAAYLSTGQVISGQVKLNDIFHSALAAGCTLGQVATLLNDHLRHERVDLPYYSLVGLPWLQVGGGEHEQEPWRDYLFADGGDQESGGSVRASAVALAAEEAARTATHVVYLSGRGSAIVPGHVRETLNPRLVADLQGELHAMGRAMTNLEDVPFTGLKYSRQGNMLVNVRDQVTSLASSLRHAVLLGDVDRIRRRIAAIAIGVERAELTLAEALFERGQSLLHYNDVWGETLQTSSPVLTGTECAYCGRLLVRQRATHPIIGRIEREAVICPRCGMIRDTDAHSPVAEMSIDTPELWYRGSPSTVRLTFRVRGSGARRAKFAAGLFMAQAIKNAMSFPPPRMVEVAGDEPAVLQTEVVVPAEARMHQEYVRGLVVAEGTIAFVARPVWVRPPRQARPGDPVFVSSPAADNQEARTR